jgi:nicotinamidase/pyrazinamidase
MKALLIVDVQNDFCPGGALEVHHGDEVVPVINRLVDEYPLVIASQDWHPTETSHFNKWPAHCVAGTQGAQLHPRLRQELIASIFKKGTTSRDDGYSVFEATNANLEEYLKECQVEELDLCGLATDYCVKETALDAARRGFHTRVITNAVAAVGDPAPALERLREAGVELVEA